MTLFHNIPIELANLQQKLNTLRKSGQLEIQNGDEGYASAPSNIALLKYWGKDPHKLQIPDNSSISFTLNGFRTFTKVRSLNRFLPEIPSTRETSKSHQFILTKEGQTPSLEGQTPAPKLNLFLNSILSPFANDITLKIETTNQFPTACGIASSASGYAALAGAIADMLNLQERFSPQELQYWISQWARIGSGSATRSSLLEEDSLFVMWKKTSADETQTENIPHHPAWQDVSHCVFILDGTEKSVSSSAGHTHAPTSVFHKIRVAGIHQRINKMKQALAQYDFETIAHLTEEDAFAMHAVMQTGTPPACYLNDKASSIIAAFVTMRNEFSWNAFWTLDAGPNVHFIFKKDDAPHIAHFHSLMESFVGDKIRVLYNTPQYQGLKIGQIL